MSLVSVGRLGLFDLEVVAGFHGQEGLPHPLIQLAPPVFGSQAELEDRTHDVPDRFHRGDLQVFQQWFHSLANCDLRVECTGYANGRDLKVLAHRAGERGFLATQQDGQDSIDVYRLSPFDLGPAIAGLARLAKPGRQAKLLVTDHPLARAPRAHPSDDEDDVSIGHRVESSDTPRISYNDAVSIGRAQSRRGPAARWGFDIDKDSALWLTVDDDGDYMMASNRQYWLPATRQNLASRLDALIAEDVRALRELRGTR